MYLRAVSRSGQPKEELTAQGTIKCAFTRSSFDQFLNPVGNVPVESCQIFMFPNNGVELGDIIIHHDTRWAVKRLRRLYDYNRMRSLDKADLFAEDQTL